MAWLYAPGSEGWNSESDSSSPPTGFWHTSSGKHTRRPSSWPGWKKRPWIRLLSGTTSRPSTADRLVTEWISSRRASHASPSPSPGNASEKTTSDGSGTTSNGSFARFDPRSSSWRTSQASLFTTEDCLEFSGTWPVSGSMRNGASYPRPPLEHLTSDAESSSSATIDEAEISSDGTFETPGTDPLYPTPAASSYGSNQGGSMGRVGPVRPSLESWARTWPTPRAMDGTSAADLTTEQMRASFAKWGMVDLMLSRRVTLLEDGVDPSSFSPSPRPNHPELGTWPTPTAEDSQSTGKRRESDRTLTSTAREGSRSWATPTAGDAKSSGSRNAPGSKANLGTSLTDQIKTGDSKGRRSRPGPQDPDTEDRGPAVLNPLFVEHLMGFPIGWTGFTPSETPSSLYRRLGLSSCSPDEPSKGPES